MYLYVYRSTTWAENIIAIQKSNINREKFESFVKSCHFSDISFHGYYIIEDMSIYKGFLKKIERFKIKPNHFYKIKIDALVKLCDDIFEMKKDSTLCNFLADKCWKTGKVQASILYNMYKDYGGVLTLKEFSEELKKIGVRKKRTQKCIVYIDVTPKWEWTYKKGEMINVDESYKSYCEKEKEKAMSKKDWLKILVDYFKIEEVKDHILLFPSEDS